MAGVRDITAMVIVGLFWGCTNPLLRRGSMDVDNKQEMDSEKAVKAGMMQGLVHSLFKFRHVVVWLPYLLNQAGSLLFYFLLSNSDLSLAVPTCNALSLVFSIATSYLLGERVTQPLRTTTGASLVVAGVALCISTDEGGHDTLKS